MDCVFFNNILIQILRFAYFPITNSKGENSFHRHFKSGKNNIHCSLPSSYIISSIDLVLLFS